MSPFALIAQAEFKPIKGHRWPCDVKNSETAHFAYVGELTILLDGNEIVVLGTDGIETTWTLSEPVNLGQSGDPS